MKTLIFSDTHLTHRFDKNKFNYLIKLFSSVDQIIINGDFWDGLSTSFERFINSGWKGLFPLLKAKKTIYIYGNHDFSHMSDKRVNLFSVQQLEEHFIFTNPKKLVLRHGHQHTPSIQTRVRSRLFLKFLNESYEIGERVMFALFGREFFRHSMYKRFTHFIHDHAKKNMGENEVLVCGHSHNALFQPENKYINSGFIRHGLAQYLLIENDKIRAVEERY